MKLNEIRDNQGSSKRRMRVGRGIGSGKGKTCGRGGKGQTARTGVAINGFEGGQMPLHRRLPKRGFSSRNRVSYQALNTGMIQKFIDSGALDIKKPVDGKALLAAGLVRCSETNIKLLAKGELTTKITISVTKASKAAVAAVEKAGGQVTLAA